MNYTLIDTHCHPQFPQYDGDRQEVIDRALARDIGMLVVGTDIATSRLAVELASKYEGIYTSVGLHPNDNLGEVYERSEYEALAAHPNVVAIGEVGLDYYRTTDETLKKKQKDRFLLQLDLARTTHKPVIIHCREAHDDMIEILRDFDHAPRGVIHSFNGSIANARTYLDRGYLLGLNGIVTFSRDYEEMVRYIPRENFVLETDAPYLTPAPHRGQRNEPSYVEAVGNLIADIRGESAVALFRTTTSNAMRLFGIIE